MPKFRFETTTAGQTTAFEEELDSPEMASPRAIEKARAAMVADGSGTEQSGSVTRVYDEADIWSPPSIFLMYCPMIRTPLEIGLASRLSRSQA